MGSTQKNEKKLTTKEKLINSAVKLFSENWYDAISIAEICRNGGLSNGVFYRYFKSKEEIFTYILDRFLHIIESRFENITGENVEQRLVSFFGYILESNVNDITYISIFREGEYRFPDYERSLRDIYIGALTKVYRRSIRISEYLFIVGSIRFLLRRPCFIDKKITAEYLKDIIYYGIFSIQQADMSILDLSLPPAFDNPEEADTRTKLLLSGKELIAEHSFYKVNIFEIARNAGFAVGTFYIHFSSKEEFFKEVVLYLGKQLRTYIASHQEKGLNRLEMELQGWIVFLKYFETHVQNYQLVREAEFVIKDTARDYYNQFERGYLENLDNIKFGEKDIAANLLIGIAHFIGIEYFYSKNITDVKKVITEIKDPLCSGLKE